LSGFKNCRNNDDVSQLAIGGQISNGNNTLWNKRGRQKFRNWMIICASLLFKKNIAPTELSRLILISDLGRSAIYLVVATIDIGGIILIRLKIHIAA